MNYKSIFKLILVSFICIFLASSCTKEGPMGPAGADGADGTNGTDGKNGVDGNVSCLVCHASETMDNIQAQFSMSFHSVGSFAVGYAGGNAAWGCAQCHSHEGFVQYATFGKVAGNIQNPTPWKCNTCHGLHKTFEAKDYAMRLSDPVIAKFDKTTVMDLQSNSNLCANCHQSWTPEPNLSNPGEETFNISSTHYGPHHGPQANAVYGAGFAEIEGSVSYPSAGGSMHLNQASCTGCHMGSYGNGSGGHTWKPSLDACNSCHSESSDDFNYGGVQTEVQSKLVELRDKLIELGVVEGDDEHGYHPVVGTYPMAQARAFYNWVGLEEDRSLGAHNPKYVKALLINTMEAISK